jgi:hypothetical protein
LTTLNTNFSDVENSFHPSQQLDEIKPTNNGYRWQGVRLAYLSIHTKTCHYIAPNFNLRKFLTIPPLEMLNEREIKHEKLNRLRASSHPLCVYVGDISLSETRYHFYALEMLCYSNEFYVGMRKTKMKSFIFLFLPRF